MAVPEGTLRCFPAPSYNIHQYTQSFETCHENGSGHFIQVSTTIFRWQEFLLAKQNLRFWLFQWHVQSAIIRSRIPESYIWTNMQTVYSYHSHSQLPIAHLTFLLIPSESCPTPVTFGRDDFDPSGHIFTVYISSKLKVVLYNMVLKWNHTEIRLLKPSLLANFLQENMLPVWLW